MNRLLLFIRKVYVGAIFIVLELLSILFYANSSPYTQAKLLTASNSVLSGVNGCFASLHSYFGLSTENEHLAARVTALENELAMCRSVVDEYELNDGLDAVNSQFHYSLARVVNNTVSRQRNFITINKGYADNVHEDMALLTADGCMLGRVVVSDEHYSVCMSILNVDFKASGHPLNNKEFGSIGWDGSSQHHVVLSEIPKYADIEIGDTVVSTSHSFVFPEGVKIGVVEQITNNDNSPSSTIRLRLCADVMSVDKVLLVENVDATIIKDLENSVNQ